MRKVFVNSYGFTLIELIVSFSIIAILSVVGIASFVTYSRTQAVDNEVSQLVADLNQAKAKAQSQVKPSGCSEIQPLTAYLLSLNTTANTYSLVARCSGRSDITISSKSLSSPIAFTTGNPTPTSLFVYNVLSGSYTTGSIYIQGSWTGQTIQRAIRVNQNGTISIDTNP